MHFDAVAVTKVIDSHDETSRLAPSERVPRRNDASASRQKDRPKGERDKRRGDDIEQDGPSLASVSEQKHVEGV